MSGIEVAGLVLGAFPVVFTLIQGYKEGCKPLGSWWRFQKTFSKLLQDIRYQETRLHNYCEILLRPLVEEEDELKELLENPSGPAWRNRDLEDALKRRLGNPQTYDRYRETIETLQQKLAKFQKQLGIDDHVKHTILQHIGSPKGGDVDGLRTTSRIDWKYERSRIRVSWGRRELLDTIADIDQLNKKLFELLGDSDKLIGLEQKRSQKRLLSVQRLRNQATALYGFLSKQWPCSCRAASSARVFLKHKSVRLVQGLPVDKSHSETKLQDASFEIIVAIETAHGTKLIWEGPLACLLADYHATPTQGNLPPSSHVGCARDQHDNTMNTSSSRRVVQFQDPTRQVNSLSSTITQPADGVSNGATAQSSKSLCLCMGLKGSSGSAQKIASGPFIEGTSHLIMLSMMSESSKSADGLCLVPLSHCLSQDAPTVADAPVHTALSISERIRLAVDLASSFFYIFGTPWYRPDWGKDNVQLAKEEQSTRHAALVERRFPDWANGAVPLAQDPQEAFFRLMICLEELCLGKPLECLATYTKYCGPDGSPHVHTARAAAQEVLDQVEGQLGSCYFEAVRNCLKRAVSVDRTKPESSDFWQQAHDDIVGPLQKVLQVWVSDDLT